MTAPTAKPLHLPWNQAAQYWLCVIPTQGALPAGAQQALTGLGMQEVREGAQQGYVMLAPQLWAAVWGEISAILSAHGAQAEAAIIPASGPLDAAQIDYARKSCTQVDAIARSLWLGEALMAENLLCYLQPVVSSRDKIFGYESFARVRRPDSSITGGAAIVDACKALSIEYTVDRQLQIQAIKTFVASDCAGSLFINFFPGFIQRPEVYLEGLTETVRAYGVVPKHIVLDVTRSESSADIAHIRRVCDYCRSKGYLIALDDVESAQAARSMVAAIRPDYVKLDMKLVQSSHAGGPLAAIRQIVEDCHENGAMVVAEGVETQEIFTALKQQEVDLFQGYYFSPPVPVEQLRKLGS